MDVNQEEFFEEFKSETAPMVEDTPIKLPLPDEDFNEFGRVKKVRGRMLKKLLKNEMKHYLPILLGLGGLILLLSIFFAIQFRIDLSRTEAGDEYELPGLLILSATLYIVSMFAMAIYAFVAPIQRYENNFFKNEGYLTFSIPASMEEQVFAKRISAIICSVASTVVSIVSVLLIALIMLDSAILETVVGSIFEEYVAMYSSEPVHAVLFTIEDILSAIVGLFTLPCLFCAGSCVFSRFSRRKQMVVGFLVGLAIFTVIESTFIALISSGATEGILQSMLTPVGQHIWNWLGIIFEAGIAVGCIFFELHFLKKKLDLK